MNVEKTIEFLIQNQAAHDERLARLEHLIGVLAEKTNHLDDVMATLAESHIKLIERMDTGFRESVERDKQLGERIDSLVRGIGEFIRNRPTTG